MKSRNSTILIVSVLFLFIITSSCKDDIGAHEDLKSNNYEFPLKREIF